MKFNTAIENFKTYLVLEKSLSGNTIDAYLTDIVQLSKYCEEKLQVDEPDKINEKNLLDYFQTKNRDNEINPRTLSRAMSSIRSFYQYLKLEGLVKNSPCLLIKTPKQTRKIPVVLSSDEIKAMFDAVEMFKPEGQRNKALVALMLDTGITVTESIGLKLSNINFYSGTILIEGDDNKNNRTLSISKDTKKEIKQYLKSYRCYLDISKGAEDILFLNKKGRPLSRVMIFNIIKNLANRAKINKNVSPHTLRHTCAYNLTCKGVSMNAIKDMLGHASIVTTEIYTHI